MEDFLNFFINHHLGVNLVLLCVFSLELKDFIKNLRQGNTNPEVSKTEYMIIQVINLVLLMLFLGFIIVDYFQFNYIGIKYFYFISALFFAIAWIWPMNKDE